MAAKLGADPEVPLGRKLVDRIVNENGDHS
jgi:hypothetical protein